MAWCADARWLALQYCEPEVTLAGGIYIDVPPTGAHVDGNIVSAKGEILMRDERKAA